MATPEQQLAGPRAPTATITGLCSHNNKLFAVTNNGQIWMFSWGGPGQVVNWVEMWDPANPNAIPIAPPGTAI